MSTLQLHNHYPGKGEGKPIHGGRTLSGKDIEAVDSAPSIIVPVHTLVERAIRRKCLSNSCGYTITVKGMRDGSKKSTTYCKRQDSCDMPCTDMTLCGTVTTTEQAYAVGAELIAEGEDPGPVIETIINDPSIGDHPAPPLIRNKNPDNQTNCPD